MADAVREGAESIDGSRVSTVAISSDDIQAGRFVNEESIVASDAADAIIFGCPTYMGSVSAQMKSYLDASLSRWYARGWGDKGGIHAEIASYLDHSNIGANELANAGASVLAISWAREHYLPADQITITPVVGVSLKKADE